MTTGEKLADPCNPLEKLENFQIIPSKDPDSAVSDLEKTGFSALARNDLPSLPIRLPLDWNANPFSDGNWMFQLHAWRMLDPYLNRLATTERVRMDLPDGPGHDFSRVMDIITDWCRANINGTPGNFTWDDMATGIRASKIAFLLILNRRHDLRFPDRDLLGRLISLHIDELSDPEKLNPGNHGIFQMHGLMSLVHACPDTPGAEAAGIYAAACMSELIDSQLGTEGVHTEHSPGYHFFIIKVFRRLLNAPWWKGAAMSQAQDRLIRAEQACFWLADPSGRCVPVGDSAESRVQRKFDGLAQWPHTEKDGILGAKVDGYGIIRTAADIPVRHSSMLFLTASFYSQTHKHSDCLSLVWQEGGRNILIDSGKYGYQKGPMRGYFLSTRAHNTVEIDRRDFSRKTPDAYGSGIRQVVPHGKVWMMEARAPHPQNGCKHHRQLLFQPGCFLVIVDHITALTEDLPEDKRLFTNWWHFDPTLDVSESGRPNVWQATGLKGGRRLHVSHVTSTGKPDSTCHLGEAGPRPQGWVSRAYLKFEPAPALGFSIKTDRDYFAATLFELTDGTGKPRLSLSRGLLGKSLRLKGLDRNDMPKLSTRFGAFGFEA